MASGSPRLEYFEWAGEVRIGLWSQEVADCLRFERLGQMDGMMMCHPFRAEACKVTLAHTAHHQSLEALGEPL